MQAYWRGEHARLFSRVPGLVSYVQNHAVLDAHGEPLGGEPGFDVFAEVEFADEATLERATGSQYYSEVILADEKNLLDASQRTFLMTRRHVLSGIPEAAVPKVALFLTGRSSGRTLDSWMSERWLAEASVAAPRATAVSVNIVDRVGGTTPRPIAVVLSHYFNRLDPAREWYVEAHRRWKTALSGEPVIECGSIAAELHVVPRTSVADHVEER